MFELPDDCLPPPDDVDALKRMRSAAKISKSKVNVDPENKTGQFWGSEGNIYDVTLGSCTCVDFMRRKKPCKHIYRLAIECGILSVADFESGDTLLPEFSFQDVIAILENCTNLTQLFFSDVLYDCLFFGGRPIISQPCNEITVLLSQSLITAEPLDCEATLNRYKRKDIVAVLDDLNIPYIRKMYKSELIKWCADNAPQVLDAFPKYFAVQVAPEFSKGRRKALSYLRRKYHWEYTCNEKMEELVYPYGSKKERSIKITFKIGADDSGIKVESSCEDVDGVYAFPEDDITELLNLYRHNRCKQASFPIPADSVAAFEADMQL